MLNAELDQPPGAQSRESGAQPAIELRLREAAWRLRLERAIAGGVYAALTVSVGLVLWLVFKTVWPLSATAYASTVLAAAAIGALVGFARPLPLLRAAVELDRRLGLDERLQSALEFAGERHRATVQALIEDVAAIAAGLRLREAIPLRPPRAARYFALSLGAGALLLLSPGIEWKRASRTAAAAGQDAAASVNAAAESKRAPLADPAPEPPPPAPLQAWEQVAFKDSPVANQDGDFIAFEPGEEDALALLEAESTVPRLRPEGGGAQRSAAGGTRALDPLDFEPRRPTQQEAADRLGQLEKLWGTPSPPTDQAPGLESEQRDDPPEESGPAEEPGEAEDRPFGDDETVDVNELHPDEERLAPQSDRFASLPKGLDSATSDLPPWPKAGPGEGKEDDSERDDEGTGRSSGKPGSGFSQFARGAPSPRIAGTDGEELRLQGLRQAGEDDSYETDLPSLGKAASASLEFQALRARYTRRAEQNLSEEWVPFDSREQVKRYFRAIEARR